MKGEKGHSETSLNQKWSCLQPWKGTNWRRWEEGRPPSPRAAPLLSAYGAEEEGVTKARAFGCDNEGPYVLLWPWLSPWPSVVRGHPGARSWPQPGKPPRRRFHTQVWMWPRAVRYTKCWRIFTCGCFGAVKEREGGREEERERQRVRWSSGQIFARSLTQQESQIASGSKHPPLFLPFSPPRLPLFTSIFFFCSSPYLFSLFVFILALVAVGPAGRHGTGWQCL